MFYRKIFFLSLLIFVFANFAAAQDALKNKKPEIPADLKNDAIEFLRETAQSSSQLRSTENRLSFSVELAGLLWEHDEKLARAMFLAAISDIRQSFQQVDAEMAVIEANAKPSINYGGNTNSNTGYNRPVSEAGSSVWRKFQKVSDLRRKVILGLAEFEPLAAYNFMLETRQVFNHATFKNYIDDSDRQLETQVLNLMARKDANKSLELARKNLEKGNFAFLPALLAELYKKDADKAVAFGEEAFAKLKSAKFTRGDGAFTALESLLALERNISDGDKPAKNRKPLFSESMLREMADLFGQAVLNSEIREWEIGYLPESYAAQIEKHAPQRAAQIRQKFRQKNETITSDARIGTTRVVRGAGVETVPARVGQSGEREKEDLLQKIGAKNLSADEKRELLEQARKEIAGLQNREEKILAWSFLAKKLADGGDRELADSVMNEAAALLQQSAKNYRDYIANWTLASGYAGFAPEKSFPLLETTVFQLNDIISGFARVAEFMDDRNEIIEDGEFQMSGFGREITNGLFKNLNEADGVIVNLSKADFGRTKALADRFERPEFRLTARLMVLRSLLKTKEKLSENVVNSAVID